jgi:predicted methyltransferase
VAAVLRAGDRAVDATVGNGHDTEFLARLVGPGGRVLGLDAQAEAVAATRERLIAAGLGGRVLVHQQGHEQLAAVAPGGWAGGVRAVMFNLGYLPGGDKGRITRPATTLAALNGALTLLAPGGRLAVVAYPGHPGGEAEADAVARWVRALQGHRILAGGRRLGGRDRSAPRLGVVERLPGDRSGMRV